MARENALGAFIAIDGSPEKAYFEDKLRANLAVWEGVHNITNDIPGNYSAAWTYGNTVRKPYPSAGGTLLGSWTHGPSTGPTGAYPSNFPLCLSNTTSPCPSTQFANAPFGANANFQNSYSAVMIAWIDDLGYCPKTNGQCQMLAFVANHFINEALNPASNIFHLSDYVYPTLNHTGNEISTWAENQSLYTPNGQPASWPPCDRQNPDEWYTGQSMSAMSYFYGLTSSQGGYSGAGAYDKIREAQRKLGCLDNF